MDKTRQESPSNETPSNESPSQDSPSNETPSNDRLENTAEEGNSNSSPMDSVTSAENRMNSDSGMNPTAMNFSDGMNPDGMAVIPRITGCYFLTGPTASGKTGLSVKIAKRIGAEIISLDSMAIYRHMDIGTAKPTLDERDGVPHFLIDIIEPSEEFSVAAYVSRAAVIADQIKARGKKVLFAGGTPLYLKGVLRGLFNGPAADFALRQELEQLEAENGPGFLHRRLESIDPKTAQRLHPNDRRRIIRALEVFSKTNLPISYFQRQHERPASPEEAAVCVIDRPREELYERINQRVDEMIQLGLEQEARTLFESDPPLSHTARQAVGYRELFDYFENKISRSEAIDLIKQHSRNFAKSQGTWFRSLPECRFLSPNEVLTAFD